MKRILLTALLLGTSVGLAQDQAPFTSGQVEAGRSVFERSCASCHGENLLGFGHAPALSGEVFINSWGEQQVGNLVDYIHRNMPLGNEGSLSDEQSASVTAFILNRNGAGTGTEKYTGTEEQASLSVNDVLAMTESTEQAPEDAPTALPVNNDEVGNTTLFTSVDGWRSIDAARISNPDAADWPSYRRSLGVQNDSPLTQINADNVAQLRHEWAWSSNDDFNFEVVPVVANGVMFVNEHTVGSGRVVALNAANGDEYWVYEREYPDGVTNRYTRGVTLFEDMVLWGSADGVVVALDASTGAEIWETTVLDYRERLHGSFGAPPVVVRDLVVIGNTLGDQGARGRLDALNVRTGELEWTAYMTPEAGASGSETWGDAIPAGATPWLPASFDEELGLLYVGTGQPSPWTPLVRGVTEYDPYEDAALYSNNIVAVDIQTGEFAWNFPVLPGEFWDFDTPFETLLFDAEVDGETRQLLYQSNKGGWAVVLDRVTGEFINAYPFAESTIIDHYTDDGTVIYRADQIPSLEDVEAGTQFRTCPFVNGARSTGAHAYSERTGLVYVAATDYCMDISYTLTGIGATFTGHLAPEQDYLGAIRALDPLTGDVAWEFVSESGAAIIGGTMSTAGGLVFAGTADRWFFALDEETGEQLWRTRLNGDVGQPITYEVEGRQFVAVVGGANFWGTGFTNPLLGIPTPEATGVVWGFALPEQTEP